MRIHDCLGALLLASFSFSAVQGQEPPASLLDAERAFADALMRHNDWRLWRCSRLTLNARFRW